MRESRNLPARADLVRAILMAGRQSSTVALLLHQAVADRLGLHPTDHKCADLLCQGGPVTAGDLAERTGLTTGAVTAVIDRLEAAGYVRREADPADRRRVIVRVIPHRLRGVGRLFEPLAAAMAELCARYTDEELATILDFMNRSAEVARRHTLWLRRQPGRGAARTRKRT
jgi:DNA-binding MarR family transcriptional regulator